MKIHDLAQGTAEWHAYRATMYNASDAPAMMGVSKYKTRNQLLAEYATGITTEVDAATQSIFDKGHRYEALARPLAEKIIGAKLYPVTGSLGKFSASFDGITMLEDVIFEHKTLNNDIRACLTVGDLDPQYTIQMEQQLTVSGAEKCLFMASCWDEFDELVEEKHFWYEPNLGLHKKIIDGWAQFEIDLANYVHAEIKEKPQAEAIMNLPALTIQIRGEVLSSNLPQFKQAAESFIAGINTDLQTDDDFANAEAMVKFCEKAEKDLEAAKNAAIAQTADIDELMRTVSYIQDQLRTKRLNLGKQVTAQKDAIKIDIQNKGKAAFASHVAALEVEVSPLKLAVQQPDFSGATKNKRTLASLHDAVDTALANGKIEADKIAKAVRDKLSWYKTNAAGFEFLFADLQDIISAKAMDDFQLLVGTRISNHKTKLEQAALEAEEKANAAIKAASNAAAETAQQPANTATELPPPSPSTLFPPEGWIETRHFKGAKPTVDEIIATLASAYNVSAELVIGWLVEMGIQKKPEAQGAK